MEGIVVLVVVEVVIVSSPAPDADALSEVFAVHTYSQGLLDGKGPHVQVMLVKSFRVPAIF